MNPWRIKDISIQRFDLPEHKRLPFDESRRYATEAGAMYDVIRQSRPKAKDKAHVSIVYTLETDEPYMGVLGHFAWVWSDDYRDYVYRL